MQKKLVLRGRSYKEEFLRDSIRTVPIPHLLQGDIFIFLTPVNRKEVVNCYFNWLTAIYSSLALDLHQIRDLWHAITKRVLIFVSLVKFFHNR